MAKLLLPIVIIITLLTIRVQVYGQLTDNFNDRDFTANPTWAGDVGDFITNEFLELQLSADGAGTSFLYTEINELSGDIQWDIDISMKFSPSNNNFNIVYLYLDVLDLSIANGYYLRIGENGSDDTVELYELVDGNESLLGNGELGLFSESFTRDGFRIVRSATGTWNVYTDILGLDIYFNEFETNEATNLIGSSGYFGLYCQYTSSNDDKFSFDNISISDPIEDIEPPSIRNISVSDNNLTVLFSEPVTSSSALDINNYFVGTNTATDVFEVSERFSTYYITFEMDFTPNVTSFLNVENIEDINGNLGNDSEEFILVEPVSLDINDVLVNEILFNPNTGGVDFIEIINVSDKAFALKQLEIHNTQSTTSVSSRSITSDEVIQPQEIIAFTSDIEKLEMFYPIQDMGQIVENPLPTFRDDDGNVSIFWDNEGTLVLLDSVSYDEDWHNPLIDNEGVSLERISVDLPSQNENTWQSAGSLVGYATPGVSNSQLVSPFDPSTDEILEFENLTFSPDNDGIEDFLFIRIRPDLEGAIGKVKIYDGQGHLVKNLLNNSILSNENFVQWDGTTDEGAKSRIGPYIVQVEYFDLTGNRNMVVKACVLAGRFN